MAAPKRFGRRDEEAEPKPFVLEYRRQIPKDGGGYDLVDEEAEFTAVAVASPGAILDFTEMVEPETGARPAAALTQFMKDVLVAEDVDRFRELVHSKDVQLDVQVIGEVATWLVEQYANRPTLPR